MIFASKVKWLLIFEVHSNMFLHNKGEAMKKRQIVLCFLGGLLLSISYGAGISHAYTIDYVGSTTETISNHLDTAGQPDPDVIIRTSGEIRMSNFLMYQAAYAEMIPVKVYWPDFDEEQYDLALIEYQKRDRRFGSIKEDENAK